MPVATVFKLAFQVTPIWLTGAPMTGVPGGMLPFAALTDPDLYRAATGALTQQGSNSVVYDLDQAFGAFTVLPGGALVNQEAAQYPFANQQVAANATIFEPLNVSLVWDTPMRGLNAWSVKYAVLQNVQARLTAHNNGGGTYTVLTPGFIYENMLLTNMSDASRGNQPIPQNAFRFDFTKPMIRITDLLAAQNTLMANLSGGLQTSGSWTDPRNAANLSATLTNNYLDKSMSPAPIPSAAGTLTGPGAAYSP